MVTAIRKGFTLVELLIVITILVILGIFVILLINPAEILAKSRDSQRISDLATMKGAMQLYLTDGTVSFTNCVASGGTVPISESDAGTLAKIYTSLDEAPNSVGGGAFTNHYKVITAADRQKNTGAGWVPIDFSTVTSGAPIEALPIDPSADTAASSTADISSGTYYRFACYDNGGKFEYEFDAGLESAAWGPKALAGDDKGRNDGGNANGDASETSSSDTGSNNRYEVGNNLRILNTTASVTP